MMYSISTYPTSSCHVKLYTPVHDMYRGVEPKLLAHEVPWGCDMDRVRGTMHPVARPGGLGVVIARASARTLRLGNDVARNSTTLNDASCNDRVNTIAQRLLDLDLNLHSVVVCIDGAVHVASATYRTPVRHRELGVTLADADVRRSWTGRANQSAGHKTENDQRVDQCLLHSVPFIS